MIRAISVVVPARDEQLNLPRCLAALDVAVRRVRAESPQITTTVTVVADGCRDGTAAIAGAWPGVDVVVIDAANVGIARATGIRRSLREHRCGAGSIWIANTDADTCVPETWLSTQRELADSGLDLVLGTVQIPAGPLPGYRPVEGHPHVHGANLGFRADAYLAAGGYPPIPEHEDVHLVDRLKLAGARWCATDAVRVTTSARTCGRTAGGFAAVMRRGTAR